MSHGVVRKCVFFLMQKSMIVISQKYASIYFTNYRAFCFLNAIFLHSWSLSPPSVCNISQKNMNFSSLHIYSNLSTKNKKRRVLKMTHLSSYCINHSLIASQNQNETKLKLAYKFSQMFLSLRFHSHHHRNFLLFSFFFNSSYVAIFFHS